VERILVKAIQELYLIKWKGYNRPTWERQTCILLLARTMLIPTWSRKKIIGGSFNVYESSPETEIT